MDTPQQHLSHDYLVGLLTNTIRDVFSMMLNMKVKCGGGVVEVVEPPPADPNGSSEQLEAFVGIAGTVAGTGVVCCDDKVACRMAGAMLLTEFPEVNNEVLDALCEIANMVVGNIKTALEDRVGPLGLSVPSVVHGRDFRAHKAGKRDWTVVPVLLPGGGLVRVRLFLVDNSGRVKMESPALHTAQVGR
jgi:chemotaxis protein CheX